MRLRTKMASFLKDDLIFDTIIVFAGTTLAGFFNLVYHLISVRLLIPEDYGTFNALIAFTMFILMAVQPLSTALVRYFTEYITKKDFAVLASLFTRICKQLFILAFTILMLFILLSNPLSNFLKTEKIFIIICSGIVVFALLILPIVSLFQSLQKFKIFAGTGIISSLSKLFIGTALMLLGWKILGGLLGLFISYIFAFVYSTIFFSKIFSKEIKQTNNLPANTSLIPIYKFFFPSALAMLSFTALTNIDVILVKHFFTSLEAGYYSIAQMAGKIALFLPSALAIVIFPKSTKAHVSKQSSKTIIYKSLSIAAIVCGFFTIFAFVFPELLLKILTGKQNSVSCHLVGLFCMALSFYALVWISINYLLAIHNLKFIFPIAILAILEAIFIYMLHKNLTTVLYILLFFSICAFLSAFFFVRKSR